MTQLLSNHIKATLFLEDFTEGNPPVYQSKCLTVQEFNYNLRRSRDDFGVPYGPTVSVIMNFAVRIIRPEDGKAFYKRMSDFTPHSYTFFFNAAFNTDRQLSDYEDAMVANGHIIDLEQVYNDKPLADGTTEQMLLKVKLLLTDITFEGTFSDKKLEIIK